MLHLLTAVSLFYPRKVFKKQSMPEFHFWRPNISKNAVIILNCNNCIIPVLFYLSCINVMAFVFILFFFYILYYSCIPFSIFLVFILLFVDIFNYSCIYYIILRYFFLYLFFYSCTYLFVIFPGILQIVIRIKKKKRFHYEFQFAVKWLL